MKDNPTDSSDAVDRRDAAPTLLEECLDARPANASHRGWTAAAVAQASSHLVADGCSIDRAARLLVALAADSEVESPAAVRNWTMRRRAEARLNGATEPATLTPPWCGRCDPLGETDPRARFLDPDAGVRCPECHPAEVLRRSAAA